MASSSEGTTSSWVREGSARIASFADRLELEGIDGITGDIQSYARRRPGMFLAATFGAGLVLSRVIKNADTRSITERQTAPRWTRDRTNGDRWTESATRRSRSGPHSRSVRRPGHRPMTDRTSER
jgi:hypothetical protein